MQLERNFSPSQTHPGTPGESHHPIDQLLLPDPASTESKIASLHFCLLWFWPHAILIGTTLIPSACKAPFTLGKACRSLAWRFGATELTTLQLSKTKQLQVEYCSSRHWPLPSLLESMTVVSPPWVSAPWDVACLLLVSFYLFPYPFIPFFSQPPNFLFRFCTELLPTIKMAYYMLYLAKVILKEVYTNSYFFLSTAKDNKSISKDTDNTCSLAESIMPQYSECIFQKALAWEKNYFLLCWHALSGKSVISDVPSKNKEALLLTSSVTLGKLPI